MFPTYIQNITLKNAKPYYFCKKKRCKIIKSDLKNHQEWIIIFLKLRFGRH